MSASSSLTAVFPVVVLGEDGVFGGVVAHRVEQRVGHVGLEADGLGAVGQFQELDHPPPGVHAAPADFALGGEAFAELLGDVGGLAEGLGDLLLIAVGVRVPGVGAGGRVDADDAVRTHAQLAKLLADPAALADLLDELLALAPRRPWPSPPPVGGQTGATTEPTTRSLGPDLVGESFEVVVAGSRC